MDGEEDLEKDHLDVSSDYDLSDKSEDKGARPKGTICGQDFLR